MYHAVLVWRSPPATVPRDHAAALKLAGKLVERGVLPPPWDAWCSGCPQTGALTFGGLIPSTTPVHVLSSPDPWTSDDRLAMFLRTTRAKELNRRFDQERSRKAAPGRTRRDLSRFEKERIAESMAPTTMFDVLWRMRKKANYDDADTFVLGAAGGLDAHGFGQAFILVADATVASLEALASAYVGDPASSRTLWALTTRRPRLSQARRSADERRSGGLDVRPNPVPDGGKFNCRMPAPTAVCRHL